MTILRVQNFQNQDDQRYIRVEAQDQNNYRLVERRELKVFERVALLAGSFFHTLQAFFSKIFQLDPDHVDQTFLKAEWESVAAYSGIRSIFERIIPEVPQAAVAQVQQPLPRLPVQQIQQPIAPQPINRPVRAQVQAPFPAPAEVQLQPAAFPPVPQLPAPGQAAPVPRLRVRLNPPVVAEEPVVQVQEPVREQAAAGDLPTTRAAKLALRIALSHRTFAGGTERNSKYYPVRARNFSDIIKHHQLNDKTKFQEFADGLQVSPNLFLDKDAQIEAGNSGTLLESCARNIPKGYSRITILENTQFNTSLLVRVTEMGGATEIDLLETNYLPGDFRLHFSDRNGARLANPDVHLAATYFLDPDPNNEFNVGLLSRLNRDGLKIRSYLFK